MSYKVIEFTLDADVADAGTATMSYPTGTTKGSFSLTSMNHILMVGGNKLVSPDKFNLTFNANASGITLTNKSGRTWAAGTSCKLQIERRGAPDGRVVMDPIDPDKVQFAALAVLDLGSPAAASNTAVVNALAVANTNEILAASVTLDVARGLRYVSSGAGDTTQTITVKGTDINGKPLTESKALNGTTPVLGTKAFKTVTSVKSSAALAGNLSLGRTDVLGLPTFLPSAALILKELEDGAAATAGTTVAGVMSTPTATTGDVYGTYDPNSACDGSKGFALVVALPDINRGATQFSA